MIIVEGMDNTGKTSLIRELVDRFPQLQLAKSPGPVTRQNLLKCIEWVTHAIRNPNPCVVYDRYSPISERVYGPVLRGKDQYGSYTFDLLRLTLRRQQPLIIYCRPPLDVIRRMKGPQVAAGQEIRPYVDVLVQRYDWFMNVVQEMYCVPGHYTLYDWTGDGSSFWSLVDVYIESNQVPQTFSNCFGEESE